MSYLEFGGYSDDIVYVDGLFQEEYYLVDDRVKLDVTIDGPRGARSFTVEGEFGAGGWKIAFEYYGSDPDDDLSCDPVSCSFGDVQFFHSGPNHDPVVRVHLAYDESFEIVRGDVEADDD